jgi:hypothetical protein
MNDVFDFVILSLAAFRLTRLITTDVILDKLRERVWKKYPPENGGLGYLITCDWCTSIWVSSLLVLLYKISSEPTVVAASVLAISGIVGLANRIS